MTLALLLLTVLALLVLALLAAPFLDSPAEDPPVGPAAGAVTELEEERDALYRSIAEIAERSDLPAARRDTLRARYEAKAAVVLRELDDRGRDEAPGRRVRRPLRPALVLLLLLAVPSVALVGTYTLPRVGADTTVTTARPSEIALGSALKAAEREAERNPSGATLTGLGDAYWQIIQARLQVATSTGAAPPLPVDEIGAARDAYTRALTLGTTEASRAQRRLGLLALIEGDLTGAVQHLEAAVEADPADAEALYSLGQAYFVLGRYDAATTAWRDYLTTPTGEADREAADLVRLAKDLAPLANALLSERSYENLMALADALWEADARARAAGLYVEVLTELGIEDPRAIGRIGIELFMEGDARSAVIALERARALESSPSPERLLFLGNAYRSLGEHERAIAAWETYVSVVGGAEQAGRVPDLIAQARAEADGAAAPPLASATPAPSPDGETLFAVNCAACHGPAGIGGTGPALTSNRRARDEALVRDAIRFGRTTMPGFQALLTPAEIDILTRYVQALGGS